MKSLPLVVPAAGRGTRALPYTMEHPKALLEVDGKTLLEQVLDLGAEIGVERAFLIVGFQAEEIKKRFGDRYRTLELRYVHQPELLGLVHAISQLEQHIQEDFIMMLCDEIYFDTRHKDVAARFRSTNPDVLCCVMRGSVEEIQKNYSVEFEGDRVTKLIEKPSPEQITNPFMGTGTVLFHPTVFEYIARTPVNPKRNQKELADLLNVMITAGRYVSLFDIGGSYVNVNYADDYERLTKKIHATG